MLENEFNPPKTPIQEKEALDVLLGQRLCAEGVPHDPRWSDAVTRGYDMQYQNEQNLEQKSQCLKV